MLRGASTGRRWCQHPAGREGSALAALGRAPYGDRVRSRAGEAVASWARADRRARWRSLTVIALVAAVTGGFALASLAGARRTYTAFARLRSTTNAPDAIVFPSQVGKFHPDWSKLEAAPEVETLAKWYLLFGLIPSDPEESTFFGSVDGTWGTKVDRPVVKQGRMYDRDAPDEIVVDEDAAKQADLHVGSVVPFHAYAPGQDDTTGAPPAGAEIRFRVVGIVRATPQFLLTPMAMLSPGVLTAHGDDVFWIENGFVRLRPGAGGIAALQTDANRLLGTGTPVLDLHAAQRRVDTTTNVEQSALVLIAVAIAAAALVLVGQMLARSAATIRSDAPVLRAIGMTPRQLAMAGARAHVFVVLGAGVGVFVMAVIASRWFPVGMAGRVDPSRGTHVDWLVLAPGALLAGALMFGSAYVIAARAARPERSRSVGARNTVLGHVRRTTPLPVGVGATMAFDQRRGRVDVAVRPAVVGAIVGVLGVVSALTIDHGLRDTLAHPERAGVTWQATITPQVHDYDTTTRRGLKPEVLARAAGVKGVRAVADVDRLVIDVNGVGVPGFTLRPPAGDSLQISLASLSGRAPAKPDEAAIGPSTMKALHVNIGDVVTVGPRHAQVRLVGRALFPTDVHSTFDEGIWLTAAGWDAAVPPNKFGQGVDSIATRTDSVVAVRFASGVSSDDGVARLGAALRSPDSVFPAGQPLELLNLKNVQRLPQVLAIFLALLAVAAMTYLLVALTRARARDFAVLRALGFTRGQSRVVVASQSTAISLIGLLVGVPAGVFLGRLAWRLISERVPLQNVPPVAVIALVVIAPLALLGANLLAAWPARRVARLRVAEVLRTE